MKKSIIIVFWTQVAFFIILVCQFYLPVFQDLLRGVELFMAPMAIFSLLGIALLVLTLKEKVEGKLGKFLFLAGISSVGFFLAVFLHNIFYALNEVAGQIAVLRYLAQALHVAFFFIAIPICPIIFLIGMTGSVVLLIKKGRQT